jgi:hypothetical protein
MIALTDSLFAGDRSDLVWFNDLRWAQTVGAAVRIILEGDAALLPLDDWRDQARDVLGLLGADGDHIEWVIRTACRVNEIWAEGIEEHLEAWMATFRRDSED